MVVTELERTRVGTGVDTKVEIQDRTPPTETRPLLQRLWRKLRTIGATQDSCITVIENPAADSYGYIGLLFATHFTEKQTEKYFTDVNYFRINTNNFRFIDRQAFPEVRVFHGYNAILDLKYEFLAPVSRDNYIILPRPTESPYRTAFFDPSHYDKLLGEFMKDGYAGDRLKELSATLAKKIDNFYLNERTGLLKLPDNYARLKIPLTEAA